jgi:hypothetical protein
MIAEVALDQFFIERFERRVRNRPARAVLFNQAATMPNAAAGRLLWHRHGRSISLR